MTVDRYNCKPTMNDLQVMKFCRQGFIVLEGIVPNKVNYRTLNYLDDYYNTQPDDLPDRTAAIPSDLLTKDWFISNVILNPMVTGLIRSLLGNDFALPKSLSNHRVKCPMPAIAPGRDDHWHRDSAGGVDWTWEENLMPGLEKFDFSNITSRRGAQNCLQVFYYPQDVPLEMGPTELMTGSHLILGEGRFKVPSFMELLDDCGDARISYPQSSSAGTITITAYPIWHRRTESTAVGIRNNLKYRYYRTISPRRDWVLESSEEVVTDGFNSPESSSPEVADSSDMFQWLSGVPV
jgi:hypothetical protein